MKVSNLRKSLLISPLSILTIACAAQTAEKTVGAAEEFLVTIFNRGSTSIYIAQITVACKEPLIFAAASGTGCEISFQYKNSLGSEGSSTIDWSRVSEIKQNGNTANYTVSGAITSKLKEQVEQRSAGFSIYFESESIGARAADAIRFLIAKCDKTNKGPF